MRRGIMLCFSGGTVTEAAVEAGCSRTTLVRQMNRCLHVDQNGALLGWFGLWPHARIKPYQRKATLPSASNSLAGTAGAFEAFLAFHPKIRVILVEAIRAKEVGQPQGTKRKARSVFRTFLRACKEPSEGLSNVDYPLCTKGKGRRAVERFVKSYLETHPSDVGPWYGRNAAKRNRTGTGLAGFLLATQPLDEVQIDAHHLDVVGVVVIPGPNGPQRIPVKRLWLCVAADKKTHTALGYSVATCVEPTAAMVEECIVCANTPWVPKNSRIATLTYLPCAGLPYGAIAGMPPCRPARITLDNAAQHFANRLVHSVRRSLGCSIEWGEIGAWWHNDVIERFFQTLETYGFHGVSSSMGTGPGDPSRNDPVGHAIRDCIEQSELIELVDVLVANYNATPSRGLGNQSPLQRMESQLNSISEPWLPRVAPPVTHATPRIGTNVEYLRVCGSLKKGRRPYVQCDQVEYTSQNLSQRYELIGTRIAVHVNEFDMRSMIAFEPATGRPLGELIARGGWAHTCHTRTDRRNVNSLRATGELQVDEGDDPIVEYMEHLTRKVLVERNQKRNQKISRTASLVSSLTETSGLPIPQVKEKNPTSLTLCAPGTPMRGIPQPNWSTVRR